jgi:hypothetical protein
MAKSDARLESIPIELRFSREVLQDREAVPSRRGWLAWLASAMGDAFEIYGYDSMVYPYRDS